MSTMIELGRFFGKADFNLCRRRMHEILVQQKVSKAVEGEKNLPNTLTIERKEEILEMEFSTLTLHLDDEVLRQLYSEKSATGILLKLKTLYMKKSLHDIIYLKGKFFGFKMTEGKSIFENIDGCNKLILDLEKIGINIDDEDKSIMILNSLYLYPIFVDTMKYARELLSFDTIQTELKAKETHSQIDHESRYIGDCLIVRGMTENKEA